MEEKAFLMLISKHQGIIHKICRLYRDTKSDREDLFQEILFQLWRSMDSFRGDSKPSSFIYRIAVNTAIVSFRNGNEKTIEYTHVLPDRIDYNDDAELANRYHHLMVAIKKLNETDRAIIAMVLEEMSYREIAEVVGISENNVAVRISRSKEKIKSMLKNSIWN